MNGDDGRRKWFIDRKFTLCAIGLVILVTLAIVISNHRRPEAYENCAQLKVLSGRSYIPEGDKLYQSNLDANHNKVACE